jgi:hypothetical protein
MNRQERLVGSLDPSIPSASTTKAQSTKGNRSPSGNALTGHILFVTLCLGGENLNLVLSLASD